MVPETSQARAEWPKPSSVKFCPAMDSNKKQIGTSGIYDVYLSHPDVPIIYRQPFVLETDNVRSFQLIGYVCCFMEEAFIELNKMLQNNEDKINEQFRTYLKEKLVQDQPTEFIEPILNLVRSLKLNVERYQLDGGKIYGRAI